MPVWVVASIGIAVVVAAVLALRAALVARARSRYPVREFPGFLSDEECAHLIATARPLVRVSKTIARGERGALADERSSETAFLSQVGDPVIQGIKKRIAEISETSAERQEKIQITHYHAGQRYAPHYDALRASRLDPGEAGDRSCTVIIYLNDDYEGGATFFPRIRRRVQPERGKAVLFHNLDDSGEGWDPLSIHAGEPVTRGEKWLSNQWIRRHRRHPAKAAKSRKRGRR